MCIEMTYMNPVNGVVLAFGRWLWFALKMPLKKLQCCVFSSAHAANVGWAFVFETQSMQNSMNHYPTKFLAASQSKLLGIVTNAVNADVRLHNQMLGGAVVKGDDVRIVVVLEKLAIDVQEIVVATEDELNVLNAAVMLACNGSDPMSNGCFVAQYKMDIGAMKLNGVGNHIGWMEL